MEDLAANVTRVLIGAGFAQDDRDGVRSGFRLTVEADGVHVAFFEGEEFIGPSFTSAAQENIQHPDHPLVLHRRTVASTLVSAYAAVLLSAGFTMGLSPETEDSVNEVTVTAGPLQGLRKLVVAP